MASVGNEIESPIPVILSHVERDVENALILRSSGSGAVRGFFAF